MVATNGNGHARVLKAGVWAPIPAFMNANEELGESGRERGGEGGGEWSEARDRYHGERTPPSPCLLPKSHLRLSLREPPAPRQLTADIATFQTHVVTLAKAGMQPVVNGSMGEAHHLDPEERVALIRAAREALDAAGLVDTVIIGGA